MTRRADIWRVRVPRPPCSAGSGASHCSPPPLKRRLLDFVKQLAMLAGMAEPDRIAAVRRFNRFYTRQIGVLRRTYLDSPYSLGEMRVLYDLATGAMTATDIVRALDLDADYVSRVLRNFEKKGLISRKASKEDARQSDIVLTVAGRKMFAPFETRSNEQVGDMLAKLEAGQQDRLPRAVGEIEKFMGGSAAGARCSRRSRRARTSRSATCWRSSNPGSRTGSCVRWEKSKCCWTEAPRSKRRHTYCASRVSAISAGSSRATPHSIGREKGGGRPFRAA